jgi:hypothetical protein
MTDRNAGEERPSAGPERVAVYDRPGQAPQPMSTTGTTGTVHPAGSGATAVAGWVVPAAVVLLLIVILLWWL